MSIKYLGVILALAIAYPAAAVELVVNGGFETGDLTGFADTSGSAAFVGSFANSGNFGYINGSAGPPGTLSQTVATVAGQSYTYRFFLANDAGAPNSFIAALGGVTLVTLTNAPATNYTLFTGTVVANVNNAVLSFTFLNQPAFFALDDVSLDGPRFGSGGDGGGGVVPEPASWALLVTGFALTGTALRRRSRALPAR